MEFERLSYIPSKNPNLPVKVTQAGNVMEIQYMSHRNHKQTIQMLPGGEQYVICSTGDIVDIEHHDTRKDNKKGLYKTFANLRGIINANVIDVSKVRWCTLTYKENMTDTKKLYDDFRMFNMRFQYYCKMKSYSKPEYIVMMEPQGRGAWHAHLLYIWQDQKAPYISNKEFSDIWGFGFVRIGTLDNVDNVGAYLTAYLGDMELDEMNINGLNLNGAVGKQIKVIESVGDNGNKVKKAVVKGARLSLYPAGFNMIRCSRGIKRPIVDMMSQNEAFEMIKTARKTYESAIKLKDTESGFETVLIKEQYNKT